MSEDNSIESFDSLTEHLLPEVRPGVYHQAKAINLDMDRGSEALVVKVNRLAYFTVARNDGHSL